jgi:inorganic triphosphatase YgiF
MESVGTTPEWEATFVIVSAEPEVTASAIADLGRIAEYTFLPGDSRTTVDSYFDTPTRDLTANHWALRVRRSDAGNLLTLKGPSHSTEWGGQERSEMEATWSKEAIERAVAELARAGITALQATGYYENDPVKTLESCGLEVIQRRELWRRTRRVVSESPGTAVAELAIDRVSYCGTSGEVFHWELELEALGDSASTVMAKIIGALIDQFGSALRPWPHSKLATGFAIEELLGTSVLQAFICSDNRLAAKAYERLDEHIRELA